MAKSKAYLEAVKRKREEYKPPEKESSSQKEQPGTEEYKWWPAKPPMHRRMKMSHDM
jgi:hypothetical protein